MFEGLADLSQEARREKFAEIRDETRKLREEAAKKALEVLTPQQREKLEKLKGEKFELDRSRMFRRPAPPTGDTPDA
jgi:Spy/CpxP family protein refolding chaperone